MNRLFFRRVRHTLGAALAIACGAAPLAAQPAAGPLPAEGERATRDLYAPIDLVVVDAAATARLAAAGSQTVPVAIRLEAGAADAVVEEFNAAFWRTRDAFLEALEAEFGARTVGSRETNSARFRSFRTEFQAGNPLFPVSFVLAQTWAKGYDGEPTRERLAVVLRTAMTEDLVGELRRASSVFVVALGATDPVRTWGEAAPHARIVERSDVFDVERAGQDLRRNLDVLDRPAGGFLTGLLRPNIVVDDHLTGLLLRERLGDGVEQRKVSRGEMIARHGEVLDRWDVLALAHLARLGLAPAESPDTAAPLPSAATVAAPAPASGAIASQEAEAPVPVTTTPPARVLPLVAVALGMLVAGAAIVWFVRWRQIRQAEAGWISRPTDGPHARPGGLREALVPHLARELKNRLVQVLFAQRQELLHNEAEASQRVAELEARLAKLQPAIAQKIRDYERRIQTLEKELEEKDQETRDLIRAKLVLARQELDAEISRHRIHWN